MSYTPPRKDMQFVLHELVGLGAISSLPGCEEVTPDVVNAILDEAGKFASDVLAPINWSGDQQGAKWNNGAVTTPDGFKQAYRQFVEGGWNQLRCEAEYGGQGLPGLVATPVEEMFGAANMAFSLCPLLTQGAIEAIQLCATPELKQRYLHKMISGDWTGTMNLTEPQAGSDLAALRSRAVPEGDHYRISGQKIFITYGEHDMADNIVHLVLARTPDAPESFDWSTRRRGADSRGRMSSSPRSSCCARRVTILSSAFSRISRMSSFCTACWTRMCSSTRCTPSALAWPPSRRWPRERSWYPATHLPRVPTSRGAMKIRSSMHRQIPYYLLDSLPRCWMRQIWCRIVLPRAWRT